MAKTEITITILIALIATGFSQVEENRMKQTGDEKLSPESLRTFNPFSINSWMNIPSEVLQYWFPLFRPAYYPSYLQRPTTVRPQPGSQNQTEKGGTTKDKPTNIFGMCCKSSEDVVYLPPPSEIEW